MNIMSLFYFSLKCYDVGLSLKSIKAQYKYRKYNKLAQRNVTLSSYKTSKKCYICGNGPSLKKVNLDELDGDTIVMNDHWRIAPNYQTPPTYYIVNDNAYGLDSFNERLTGVMECHPDIPHIIASNIGPAIDARFCKYKTNVFYFNPIGKTYNHKYKIDFTKITYCTWNVVSAAIQLAIYLGYKEICLLGCDYSLFASRYLSHAYDKEGIKIPCQIVLRDMLYKYTFTTHIHYEIARYAKENGIKIINMTSESLLDAYEIDINSKY
jgi:hypothetical protein